MTTTVSDLPASASDLRTKLADLLRDQNTVRTPVVDAALRSVPRHLFLPAVSLQEAYVNQAVYTKHDDSSGASISAASQPAIVAMMLEQLRLEPGQRVLELGAGTGYNAALMAAIVCHRHAMVYLRTLPLGAHAAIRALEPLVNLARLHIRDGNGEHAFTLLDALYTAVATRADTTIDGIPLPAATLTASPDAHQEVRRWLWAVLLATGARALARAGHWNQACTQLHRHKGIGRRILDGRQVAVLARATVGDTGGALALLADTIPGEPWENAVAACLTALCRQHTDQPADRDAATLLDRYRQLDTGPGLAVFHTRLGLSVIDATGGIERRAARRIAADLLHRATTARDGYTARDLLSHDGCVSALNDRQAHDLAETVNACALGSRAIPEPLQADLSAALDTSEAVLTRTLKHHPASTQPAR